MTGATSTRTTARDAIFGYTIVNDWSARDIQAREMKVGLGPAKGKDFATSIGPWIVTADEVEDRVDADGLPRPRLPGLGQRRAEVGRDRLSNMNWTFPQMVAYASRDSVVVRGDLLASGTTGGGGCLAELWGRNGTQDPAAARARRRGPHRRRGDRVARRLGGPALDVDVVVLLEERDQLLMARLPAALGHVDQPAEVGLPRRPRGEEDEQRRRRA